MQMFYEFLPLECALLTQSDQTFLNSIGLYTISDVLYFFPSSYDVVLHSVSISNVLKRCDYSLFECLFTVRSVLSLRGSREVTIVKCIDCQGSEITAMWFNSPYLSKVLYTGKQVILRGNIKDGTIVHPDILIEVLFVNEEYTYISPRYPSVGKKVLKITKAIKKTLKGTTKVINDTLANHSRALAF